MTRSTRTKRIATSSSENRIGSGLLVVVFTIDRDDRIAHHYSERCNASREEEL